MTPVYCGSLVSVRSPGPACPYRVPASSPTSLHCSLLLDQGFKHRLASACCRYETHLFRGRLQPQKWRCHTRAFWRGHSSGKIETTDPAVSRAHLHCEGRSNWIKRGCMRRCCATDYSATLAPGTLCRVRHLLAKLNAPYLTLREREGSASTRDQICTKIMHSMSAASLCSTSSSGSPARGMACAWSTALRWRESHH